MAGVSGNRRTLYTKKVIKESLIELLKTRNSSSYCYWYL